MRWSIPTLSRIFLRYDPLAMMRQELLPIHGCPRARAVSQGHAFGKVENVATARTRIARLVLTFQTQKKKLNRGKAARGRPRSWKCELFWSRRILRRIDPAQPCSLRARSRSHCAKLPHVRNFARQGAFLAGPGPFFPVFPIFEVRAMRTCANMREHAARTRLCAEQSDTLNVSPLDPMDHG